jgi:Maltose acetyltransferase
VIQTLLSGEKARKMATSKEWQKMLRGELYQAGDQPLQDNRTRSKMACREFNEAGNASRRSKVELWRK